MRHIGIVTIFLLLPSLSACGLTAWQNVPDDLRLAGLTLHAGAYANSKGDGEPIDVDLVSNFNYAEYVTKKPFEMVNSYGYFCDKDGKYASDLESLDVFTIKNNSYLSLWNKKNTVSDFSNDKPPYHYHINIFIKNFSKNITQYEDSISPHEGKPAMDVCLKFMATNAYSFIGIVESNVVHIQKEELIKLFTTEAQKSKTK